VVVLTVIIFGGTTARMLEVLGIRMGVEDEDASSDEEDGWTHPGNLALNMGPGSRRFANRAAFGDDPEDIDLQSPQAEDYAFQRRTLGRLAVTERQRQFSQHSRSGFSTNSSESEDNEPLSATAEYEEGEPPGNGEGSRAGMIFRDGQWFTALDERYLLPLFSNSFTARQAAKRRAKKASVHAGAREEGESANGTPRGPSLDVPGGSGGGVWAEEDDAESENGKNKFPRTFR
jgi:sodium/hydrogen exchanger-like protein 6/7